MRILTNLLGAPETRATLPKVRSLGIGAISFFIDLDRERLPPYLGGVAEGFRNINANLFHGPTYRNEAKWRETLRRDGERTLVALAELGINNYPWMIECNLYGYPWHPSVGRFVHRDRLVELFNAFYKIAHDVNPDANVIVVPYSSPTMNLNCGRRGWKDWWVKHGERMKFDQVALDAHVGVWIQTPTKRHIYEHLLDSVGFLQDRGYPVLYVEVGYPTTWFRLFSFFSGMYGWGRERDQVEVLDTCYRALSGMKVPWMQICEIIDPSTDAVYDTPLLGDAGRTPKFLGLIPVVEERHWGIFRSDGSEKLACDWVRRVTGRKPVEELHQ